MILRRATKEDLPAIMAIEEESFTSPWPVTAFESELTNEVAVVKVLVVDDKVVGYYDAWFMGDEAHLLNIAVASRVRGKGFGGRLLDDALDEARRAGCAAMYLEVRKSNEIAKRLYATRGFTVVGSRRRYYADGEDADVMKLALGAPGGLP